MARTWHSSRSEFWPGIYEDFCAQTKVEGAQQRADHGPRLAKPAKRKASVSHFQPPLSTAQPHAWSGLVPVQPPRKLSRAPFAAAAGPGQVQMGQSMPEDDHVQHAGKTAFQADAAADQLQPLPNVLPPKHARLSVPVVTLQLPVDLLAQVGSCGAESTALPKTKEPSSSAQLSAGQTLPPMPHASACCAARLEVRSCCISGCLLQCDSWLARQMPCSQSCSSCAAALHFAFISTCLGRSKLEDPSDYLETMWREASALQTKGQPAIDHDAAGTE